MQPSRMHGKELQPHTDVWLRQARDVVLALPSVDYVSSQSDNNHSGSSGECGMAGGAAGGAWVGLKELPIHRQLDCGKDRPRE
jgi:hypothetical protein